ncbi:MAG TPA: hypothetical protein VKU41_16730, partial [Polyangiaceae bacterium]|nr:hypothetical protein [Polyangiaceae bacterium]
IFVRMVKVRPPAILTEEEAGGTATAVGSIPERSAPSTSYSVASHRALFAEAESPACDACGGPLPGEDDEGYDPPGHGVYLWARGDDVRVESAPLCSRCASAIGMTALARWEIEEEEG